MEVVSCYKETTLKSMLRMLNTDFDEYLKNSQSQGTFVWTYSIYILITLSEISKHLTSVY